MAAGQKYNKSLNYDEHNIKTPAFHDPNLDEWLMASANVVKTEGGVFVFQKGTDDGKAKVLAELSGSKVQQEIQTLEPRTDDWINIDIPHTSDGVFEQMIIIKHTLDATLWVVLIAKTPVTNGYLFSDFKLEANRQLILTPESDGFTNDPYGSGVTTISKPVVDLRMPYSGFRLGMRPRVSASDRTPKAPTTGDITVATIKRY